MPDEIEILECIKAEITKSKKGYPIHIRAVCMVLIEDLIKKKSKRRGDKNDEKINEPIYIGRVNF
jgi:hypothetical protein